MKRAIISDIHGNLEALEAVLQDIACQGADQIYCLGDVVGYGPNPCECVDRAMEFDAIVLGNHDQGALFDPEGFSLGAERAIFWTRQQLETCSEEPGRNRERWDFLCELPRCLTEEPFLFVHGSPRNPLSEYVFPEDAYNARKLAKIFALVPHYCCQGHTHVPGVFTEEGRFFSPDQLGGIYTLTNEKCLINVGSVGQPRDGDPRACYVLIEENLVHFRRLDYPFEETATKIFDIPELDRFLGERLRSGR